MIRIVSDLDGNPVNIQCPYRHRGFGRVQIGDSAPILGYPGIGGDTITFTEGVVSGFTSDRSIDGRAWIKTDATIAGGNSGGLGANAVGELVGVPNQGFLGSRGRRDRRLPPGRRHQPRRLGR